MIEHPASPALTRAMNRSAGVGLHLSSLPGSYGIGELGASAFAFIDTMVNMRLKVWQFLPLGPTAFGNSPYQPTSSFAGNELLIDVGSLIEQGLITEDLCADLRRLPRHRVDYARLIPTKNQLLDHAAERFLANADARQKTAFDAFVETHDQDWLHDYALFKTLKAAHGGQAWRHWPSVYAQRDAAALEQYQATSSRQIRIAKVIQFLFFEQWNKLRRYARDHGVELFGDMPIYIAADSADVWAARDLVCLDTDGDPTAVAGVPPDYFSNDGQRWGNPLYNWPRHEADGFAWWVRRLQSSVDLVDIVRIDHFRGFEAYWSVPAEETTARNGQWVTGPGDALFSALHTSLGHLPIVAEDLGVITDTVDALRDRHHLPGMRVLQFELGNDEFSLAGISENSVCYTGTHDNDTLLGWFLGDAEGRHSEEDIQKLQRQVLARTGRSADTLCADLIRMAFSSPAGLAIAPLQDFLGLGSSARMNTPGETADNWSWRVEANQLDAALEDRVAHFCADAKRDQ